MDDNPVLCLLGADHRRGTGRHVLVDQGDGDVAVRVRSAAGGGVRDNEVGGRVFLAGEEVVGLYAEGS
jgi:hypothetical protein